MMPQTIWKYPLETKDFQLVEMPKGAKILHVAIQRDQVCLWAQVDPKAPLQEFFIRTYCTGYEIPPYPGAYIGTYRLDGKASEFHVYEARF